ncbi:hypothetical protein ACFYUD_05350 [Nocardia tengchongensis]|uniref:hypothetical protein n=1 Tax=Nocardia tengchongensis TaxID=2055889 RepID=UPI0036CE7747
MATPIETRPAPARIPDGLLNDFSARWTGLAVSWGHRSATVGTIGPAGTSSDVVADLLVRHFGMRVRLFTTFDDVLAAVTAGAVDLALVPSAYHGITGFHWHPGLRLLAYFQHATPEYGIVCRSPEQQPDPAADTLTVASMWEVRDLFAELAPAALAERTVHWLDAESTQHAARLVAEGACDLGITNTPGVESNRLSWIAKRPGAEIVWSVFENIDACRSGDGQKDSL